MGPVVTGHSDVSTQVRRIALDIERAPPLQHWLINPRGIYPEFDPQRVIIMVTNGVVTSVDVRGRQYRLDRARSRVVGRVKGEWSSGGKLEAAPTWLRELVRKAVAGELQPVEASTHG